MPATAPDRQDDERLLRMLDLRDHEGMKAAAIARYFGVSRNAVIGLFHRQKTQDKQDCLCRKPENQDGGMSRKWWAK
jgi:hypothetical protein